MPFAEKQRSRRWYIGLSLTVLTWMKSQFDFVFCLHLLCDLATISHLMPSSGAGPHTRKRVRGLVSQIKSGRSSQDEKSV
jgi:hypothetical protein